MRTNNIHKAEALSRLIENVAASEEIVVVKGGKPMAWLSLGWYAEAQEKLGVSKGQSNVPDDFDGLLPDDVLALLRRY